jgi:outer membrane immunogenic protein
MRKAALSVATIASLTLFTGTASADGYRSAVKDVGCALPFHGFYVGVNAGAAQLKSNQTDHDGYFGAFPASWAPTESGFIGGGLIGYNWQRSCHTLLGIEADWSWAAIDAKTQLFPFLVPFGFNLNTTSTLNSYGTLRTRTGVVFDNLLLYVTGGLAVADIEFKTVVDPGIGAERFSFSETRWGWTAGVGTEWALWRNVSFKSEVLYMDFGDQRYSVFSPGFGTRVQFSTQDSVWVGRAGLNLRF